MKHLKLKQMPIFWFLMILVGTAITVYSGQMLSKSLAKDDDIKKQHLIPDTLLLDCGIEFKFDEKLTKTIIEKAEDKTTIYGGNIKKEDTLFITAFFDEVSYKENKIAKDNFSLPTQIYDELRQIKVMGSSISEDKETAISFQSTTKNITVTPQKIDRASIEIHKYIRSKNLFYGSISNLKLPVSLLSKSQYILDLKTIKLNFITPTNMEITDITKGILKTNKTKFFRFTEIKKDNLTFEAKLSQNLP